MKKRIIALGLIMSCSAYAESLCDIRPGTSVGIKVVEFATGNQIHSKIPMRQAEPDALLEEMISLQEMSICEEKIVAQKCILKFEKIAKAKYITLYRGKNKWSTWGLKDKERANSFVKNLKRVGFCS